MLALPDNQAQRMMQTGHLPQPVVWKQVLTVLVAVVGPPAGAVLGFVATVVYSDCFIGCSGDPQHAQGVLLGALAVLLLLSGPLLAGFLLRRASWVVGTIALPVVEVLLLLARAH